MAKKPKKQSQPLIPFIESHWTSIVDALPELGQIVEFCVTNEDGSKVRVNRGTYKEKWGLDKSVAVMQMEDGWWLASHWRKMQ